MATIRTKRTRAGRLRTSAVYDSYWRFAAERQAVFFKRAAGMEPPWTDDAVLQTYKFTNAYRASDRVSQFLIRHVIYGGDVSLDPVETFFRIMLFKVFNKIETWELLEQQLGTISYADYSYKRYDNLLTKAMNKGATIYSAAYIMPSAGSFGCKKKHRNHLKLIEKMIADELPARLQDARSMKEGFELLLSFPTIGRFLAYQFVTDVNYSELTDFTEMEFVTPGPGAIDGIRKCFPDTGGLTDSEVIERMADRQEEEFERLGLNFQDLWGRRLQLIDCQNLFCEVDKFARVAHPNVTGASGRTRIKQKLKTNPKPIDYWFPPKWGINDAIKCVA